MPRHMGTVISWHTGALEAAAARPASCARSSSSSEGGADGSGRAIAPSLPSSPAASAGPAQAGETGIRASLSADLCGAGTGNLLVSFSFKEIRPKINFREGAASAGSAQLFAGEGWGGTVRAPIPRKVLFKKEGGGEEKLQPLPNREASTAQSPQAVSKTLS